jgi:hypothetical protein
VIVGPALAWTQAWMHAAALLPLLVLAAQRFRGRTPGRAAWMLALGFFVSFVADEANYRTTWDAVVGNVYPVPQFTLMGAAAAERHSFIPVVLFYVLGATVLYAAWVRTGYDMRWWYGYQATRLAAFGLFVRAAWKAR